MNRSLYIIFSLLLLCCLGCKNPANSSISEEDNKLISEKEEIKFIASDGAADDFFGHSVSVSGGYAVVGAYGDDDGGSYSGSAYVFEKGTDGLWAQTQKLTASDAAANSSFGCSVSVCGDCAVVGAYGDASGGASSGAAYVFEKGVDGRWTQSQKLTAPDSALDDRFGYSASIGEKYIVIGAYGDDDGGDFSGSAYIFSQDDSGVWREEKKLVASDPAAYDLFGYSVSISGEYVVVGAYGDDDGGSYSGSAYVFELGSDGSWTQAKKLAASDAGVSDRFGVSVSLYGEYIVVGAYGNSDGGTSSGSAYIFERGSGEWGEAEKLTASDAAAEDWFGSSVSINGDYAVVVADKDDDAGENSGSAYVFRRGTDGGWTEYRKLVAQDAAADEYFGSSVAISGAYILVGDQVGDDMGLQLGSAYRFKIF